MPLSNSVWVLIAGDEIVGRITGYIDRGLFSEANRLKFEMTSLQSKMEKEVQARGGSMYFSSWERTVAEMPVSMAEDLPDFLAPYSEALQSKLYVGIGLTQDEAAKACERSRISGRIELYDPSPELEKSAQFSLEDDSDFTLDDFTDIGPNLHDPKTPHPKKPDTASKPDVAYASFEESSQMDTAVVNAFMQQVGAGQQPGQPQPGQPQQAQPQSLLEALHGAPVEGDQGAAQMQAQQQPQGSPQQEQPEGQPQAEDEKEETPDHAGKIAALLARVKGEIPHLMDLAEKNPKAYQQTVGLIQKLIQLGKTSSSVQKSDIANMADALNKAIKLRLPVGSTRGRRKKVLVNGRAVWRSVASGQVTDAGTGQPISVKSHNAKADGE